MIWPSVLCARAFRGRLFSIVALAFLSASASGVEREPLDQKQIADLITRLKRAPEPEAVDISAQVWQLGPAAHAAVPALIARANAAFWDDRAKFIKPLGAVGDARCVSFLSDSLSSPDWRVVSAAVDALGDLGDIARPALPALTSTASNHWYPRVRDAASRSRRAVADAAPGETYFHRGGLFKRIEPGCHVPRDEGWKGEADLLGALEPEVAHFAKDPGDRFVVHTTDGGRFVGRRGAQSGGELAWLENGRAHLVAEGGVFAIVERPSALVLLQSGGTVSVLERGADKKWKARPSMQLPDKPRAYRAMPDGTLGIATREGIVFLTSKGEIARYACTEDPMEGGPVFYRTR
jgi:hypothetical protein